MAYYHIIYLIIILILLIVLISYNSFYKSKISQQNKIYSEAIKNNSMLEALLTNLPFYIWARNKQLEIIYSNKNRLDKQLNQLINYSNKISSDAIKRNNIVAKMQNIIIEGEAIVYEIKELPLQNSEIASLGIGTNVDYNENIKKEFSSYMMMYRNLLESSSHAIAFYSNDRRLVFYNDVFVKLWSFDANWLDTKPLYDEIIDYLIKNNLLNPVDISKYYQDQIKIFYSLMEAHNEFLYLADGRAIRVIIVPNNLGGLLFNYEDITNRLEIERSYNRSLKITKSIINTMKEAVIIFSENSRLHLYNDNYIKLWAFDHKYCDFKPHLSDILKTTSHLYNFDVANLAKCLFNYISDPRYDENNLIRIQMKAKILELKILKLPEGLTLFIYNDITEYCILHNIILSKNFEIINKKKHILCDIV